MPMTKAEQAVMDSLRTELALAWPRETEPARINVQERMQQADYVEKVSAWTFNAYSGEVTQGWTSGGVHCRNIAYPDSRSRECGGPWYDTEAEAWLAMRWVVTRECAARLRRVDVQRAQRIQKEPS